MTQDYGNHADFMKWVQAEADERQQLIEQSLQTAFTSCIETREVAVIVFSNVSAADLAQALLEYPLILKSLVAACNIAGRAIERDLSIKNVDTYAPRLTNDQAHLIAGYIKPFLPPYIELPALSTLDRVSFIDKEIRKRKGRWEGKIASSVNKYSGLHFKKRTFEVEGDRFEIDIAYPDQGEIDCGIDVKRIEARKDIHKRCDEIVNKAAKFKTVYPTSAFGAVVYYPFVDEHINIENRLRSEHVDAVVFAAESSESIDNAVRFLLLKFGIPDHD